MRGDRKVLLISLSVMVTQKTNTRAQQGHYQLEAQFQERNPTKLGGIMFYSTTEALNKAAINVNQKSGQNSVGQGVKNHTKIKVPTPGGLHC